MQRITASYLEHINKVKNRRGFDKPGYQGVCKWSITKIQDIKIIANITKNTTIFPNLDTPDLLLLEQLTQVQAGG